MENLNPKNVQPGQIWELEGRRFKIISLDVEDARVEFVNGKTGIIWLRGFGRAELIKVAGNWRK